MKKIFVFVTLALIIAVGLAAYNTNAGFSAPKQGDVRVLVEFQPGKKVAVSNAAGHLQIKRAFAQLRQMQAGRNPVPQTASLARGRMSTISTNI